MVSPFNLHQVGLTPEAWEELHPDSQRCIKNGCLAKTPRTINGARLVVAAQNKNGKASYSFYRCPFTQGAVPNHYHVGHAASISSLEAIALAIRDIHHDRPPERTPAP